MLDAVLPFFSRITLLFSVFAFFFGGLAWIVGLRGPAKVLLGIALALAALGAYLCG